MLIDMGQLYDGAATVNVILTALHRHDAQQCFCGEPNCVSSIGGRTQTDVGAMDDVYLDGTSHSPAMSFLSHSMVRSPRHHRRG
jgi:hypothetical protein